jgi:hypothetical protein
MSSLTDTGNSAFDNITKNASPTFVGTTGDPAATSVILYVDSQPNGTAAVAGGNYSLTPATPLTDGPHTVQVTETTAPALTESLSKGALAVTIDTVAPVAPDVTAPASPGSSSAPLVMGSAEAGSTASLFTNPTCTPAAVASGSAAAFASPGFSAVVSAGSSTRFSATAGDVAGNLSPCSTSLAVYTQDSVLPTVTTHNPVTNATSAVQAGSVSATFSKDVTGVGSATFTLKASTGATVPAVVTYNAASRVANLDPTPTLAAATTYTATLTSGVKDTAGNPLTAVSWNFRTGPRPTVMRKSPGTSALGVSRVANTTATFSENVRGLSRTTFTLRKTSTGAAVTVAVTYNATTHMAILNPRVTLAARTKYTARLSSLVKDADGNAIAAMSWSFTTGR